MKIVMNETYDYLYNVWTYEKGHVYDVEDVPRSDFYHDWHGPNLDVIPHSIAHPASANEIKSLPDGDALHKHDKPVRLSMDSVLNPKHVDIPESERPVVIEGMDEMDDKTSMTERDTAEEKKTARATRRKTKNGSDTPGHAENSKTSKNSVIAHAENDNSDNSSSDDCTQTAKKTKKKTVKTADDMTAVQTKRKDVRKAATRKTAKSKEE